MSAVPATAESSEYVRVKRKRQTIFLYANMPIDTVHDLRARANLVTKVPTSEMRFYLDESGEVLLDENKTLKEQKVSHSLYGPKAQPTPRAPRAPKLPSRCANLFRMPNAPAQIENDMVLYMVYRIQGACRLCSRPTARNHATLAHA